MGAAERREEIMRIMFMRRHDTAENLASEFGVSVKTILRDVKALEAAYKPIYTEPGRYGGGIHIVDGCNNNMVSIIQLLMKDSVSLTAVPTQMTIQTMIGSLTL